MSPALCAESVSSFRHVKHVSDVGVEQPGLMFPRYKSRWDLPQSSPLVLPLASLEICKERSEGQSVASFNVIFELVIKLFFT